MLSRRGGLVPIASGRGHDAAIAIRQNGAVLWGGRLKPGESVLIPDAPFVHVFIAKGSAELENEGRLNTGDAARLTGAGRVGYRADSQMGAEVLVWRLHRILCSNQKGEDYGNPNPDERSGESQGIFPRPR